MYKRQQVTFSIPNTTGFEYDGIQDFKGLHITDNPFVANKGSASDLLNVYVDETNKLVTRPRLDYNYDIKTFAQGMPTTWVDSVKFDSYILYLGNSRLFKRIIATGVTTEITAEAGYTIPNAKLKCFEKDGVLYFFDGLLKAGRYYYAYLDGNTLKHVVDFYIPTLTVGRSDTFAGTSYETLNILTNKYRETWRWDKSWSIVDNGEINSVLGKGTFISQNILDKVGVEIEFTETENLEITGTDTVQVLDDLGNDNIYVGDEFVIHNGVPRIDIPAYPQSQIYICASDYVGTDSSITYFDGGMDLSAGDTFSINGSDKIDITGNTYQSASSYSRYTQFVLVYKEKIVKLTEKGIVTISPSNVIRCYDYDKNLIKEYDLSATAFDIATDIYQVSDDFNIFTWLNVSSNAWIHYIIHRGATIIDTVSKVGYNLYYPSLTISPDNSMILVLFNFITSGYDGTIGRRAIFDTTSESPVTDYLFSDIDFQGTYFRDLLMNFDGTVFIGKTADTADNPITVLDQGLLRVSKLKGTEEVVTFDSNFRNPVTWSIQTDNLILYRSDGCYLYINISTEINRSKLEVPLEMISNINIYEDYVWAINDTSSELLYISNITDSPIYSRFLLPNDTYKYHMSEVRWGDGISFYMRERQDYNPKQLIKFFMDINSPFQEVVYEKEISSDTNSYTEWLALSSPLYFCTMFTNFMNNFWVVRDNVIMSSDNNNPLYFPIDKYNKFNENITGLNRLGDTLLAAYSASKIYLQQPITQTDGSYIMTSTETKAIKGNVAMDEPIVTSITGYPVQIANDGIYALQLEENVQSAERITILMSEKINKKLLLETMSTCKTFNYKYYTYFVYPKTTTTNIFILDNRSNEWFYWELPIKVITMFNVDEIMWVVSSAGITYTFQKEDEIADSAISAPITIYCDELTSGTFTTIPWTWKSQIMWMKTVNNRKQLYTTSFIILDDDSSDSYGLTYKFTVYKKYFASDTPTLLTQGEINYIKTVTQRTYISAFNFIQLTLTNPFDDSNIDYDETNSNKLNLVGIMFKYKILPGGV